MDAVVQDSVLALQGALATLQKMKGLTSYEKGMLFIIILFLINDCVTHNINRSRRISQPTI